MHEELMIWFAQAVAHSLWEGVAIGGLAWLGLRLVGRSPAGQHAILCGALGLMALSLPVNLVVLRPDLSAARAGLAEGQLLTIDPTVAAATEGVLGNETASTPPTSTEWDLAKEGEAGSSLLASIDWHSAAPWVVTIYGAGFLVMLLRFGLACGGCRRLKRGARKVTEGVWLDPCRRVRARLELNCEPLVAWSSEVAAPVLVGVFKPMVLLPVALANRLSMEQAEAVLAHELAHLRRNDQWILASQRVVETVLFYHPVTWWVSGAMSRTREQACDDMVLATGSRPADYAEALVLCSELRLARAGLPEGAAMQLAATGGKGRSLRQRVMRVLGQDDPIRTGRSGWLVAGMAALAVAVAGACFVATAEADKPARENEPVVPANENALVPVPTFEDDLLLPLGTGGDEEDRPLIRAIDPGGPPILVELLLAEVLDDYAVNDKSMQEEVVSKHGEVVSKPRLIVSSGRRGRVKTTRAEEVVNPNNPELIDYEVEVTPTLQGKVVSYTMKVTRAQGAGQGTKLLLSAEISRKDTVSTWRAFEVGSMIGGAKLAGAVRFNPAKVGQKVDPPGVFYLLPNGKVRWEGKVYGLPELKDALPHRGGEVVVKAAGDTPYQFVVGLVEVLKPVYKVRFEVAEEAARFPKRGEPRKQGDRLERVVEHETQIAECEVELARATREWAKLAKAYEEHHPKRRQTKNRIDTVRAHLEDLRAAKAALEEQEGKRADPEDTAAALFETEAKLQILRASGLGHRHPAIRMTETALDEQRARFPEEAAGVTRFRLEWTQGAIRKAEDELADLHARGLGPKHPKVWMAQQRLEWCQDKMDQFNHNRTLEVLPEPDVPESEEPGTGTGVKEEPRAALDPAGDEREEIVPLVPQFGSRHARVP